MIKTRIAFIAGAIALGVVSLTACVQPPTHKEAVVDLRGSISFKINASDASMAEARVLVDRLDSGRAGDFIEGKSALSVLPGTHQIQVVKTGAIVLDERAYIGEGVTRQFVLK